MATVRSIQSSLLMVLVSTMSMSTRESVKNGTRTMGRGGGGGRGAPPPEGPEGPEGRSASTGGTGSSLSATGSGATKSTWSLLQLTCFRTTFRSRAGSSSQHFASPTSRPSGSTDTAWHPSISMAAVPGKTSEIFPMRTNTPSATREVGPSTLVSPPYHASSKRASMSGGSRGGGGASGATPTNSISNRPIVRVASVNEMPLMPVLNRALKLSSNIRTLVTIPGSGQNGELRELKAGQFISKPAGSGKLILTPCEVNLKLSILASNPTMKVLK
mmetsp:Transcript_76212/g.153088  ORF Transcript_76212/g.153088 Transcript_76212/m.153088 type:complete len:273 (+) Transcript_76212:1442-2260(+)